MPSSRPLLIAATLLLFLIWSNSFVAMTYVLGTEHAGRQLDWIGLTVARFLPVTLVAGTYLIVWRRAEAVAVARAHAGRLVACGLLAVPCYSLLLYRGIQMGVPAPIASLTTAMSPLFLLLLGAAFLGERLTPRKITGFIVSLAGLAIIAATRDATGAGGGALAVVIAGCAPAVWAVHTALSKPIARTVPPILWTALYLVAGGLPLLVILPFAGGREILALNAGGWGAVLYLGVACSLLGFALWSWLLVRLPASTVGLTVFLNPPLTLVSQLVLHALWPATFGLKTSAWEIAASAVVLAGLGVAVTGRRTAT